MRLSGAPKDGDRIQVLPDDVIDQIAAGEVIERPASVVKELCENSFDAGAANVDVHLEEGGLGRIVVSDDGCGMSPTDVSRSVLRHATSKLQRAADLFALTTYGFRGEALSSIASVARLTITTRRPRDATGTRLRLEGGVTVERAEVGCPVGTTIEVRELFYNTPARRKFMRSPPTEQAHAVEAAQRVVLGASAGGLVVSVGERRLLDVPAEGGGAARVQAALGARLGELYPFAHEAGALRVHGFVARPELDRGDSKGLWCFVNGRYVRDRMLQRALLDAYTGMVERDRYPVAVIYLELPPASVDVNVHPQKLEVRFAEGAAVYRAVAAGLASVLLRTPWRGEAAPPRTYAAPRLVASRAGDAALGYAALLEPQAEPAFEPVAQGGYFARLRPLEVVLGRYLVCAGAEALVLVDVTAASERVACARLWREHERGQVQRQQLLLPESLAMSAPQSAVVVERGETLSRLGFELEPVGPDRFVVRAVPAALSAASTGALVEVLLDALREPDAEARGIMERCAALVPPRAATPDEQRALLAGLDGLDAEEAAGVHRVLDGAELAALLR